MGHYDWTKKSREDTRARRVWASPLHEADLRATSGRPSVALNVSSIVAREDRGETVLAQSPPPPPPPSHPASAEPQSLPPPSLKTAGIQLPSASDPRTAWVARTLDRPMSAMPTRSTPVTTTTITSTVVATMRTVCPVDISPGLRRPGRDGSCRLAAKKRAHDRSVLRFPGRPRRLLQLSERALQPQ